MALRELVAVFGVQVDDKQLKGLEKNLSSAAQTALNFGKAVLGGAVVKGIVDFVGGQIEMGAALQDTADKLGLSTDELQKFQYAAKLSGVEAEGADKALQFLNKNLGEAIGGNAEAGKTFQALGVDMKKVKDGTLGAADLLPDLADNFAKLKTPAEQTAYAMKIFGKAGAAMIPLLKGGSKGVAELFGEFTALGGGLDRDFIKNAAEADDQIDRMKFGIKGLISQALAKFLPLISKGVQYLIKLVVATRNFIKTTHVLKTLLIALAAAMVLVPLVQFGVGLISAEGGMLKFARSVLLADLPLVLLAGAVLIAYLALDELYTLMNGGDTVIGPFLDQFIGAGTAAQYAAILRQAWSQLSAAFIVLGPQIASILRDVLPYAIKGFVLITVNIVKATLAIAQLINGVSALASGDFSKIGDIGESLSQIVLGGATGGLSSLVDTGATNKLNKFGTFLNGTTATRGEGDTGGATIAVRSGDGTTAGTVVNQEIKPTIIVNGANGTKETVKEIQKGLSGVNDNANKAAKAAVVSKQ